MTRPHKWLPAITTSPHRGWAQVNFNSKCFLFSQKPWQRVGHSGHSTSKHHLLSLRWYGFRMPNINSIALEIQKLCPSTTHPPSAIRCLRSSQSSCKPRRLHAQWWRRNHQSWQIKKPPSFSLFCSIYACLIGWEGTWDMEHGKPAQTFLWATKQTINKSTLLL